MAKQTNVRQGAKQVRNVRTASSKPRWNALGLRSESRRDPAALTFARLGLLASRW